MIKLEKKNTEKGEKQKEKIQIPIWEKANLTIQEAAVSVSYTHLTLPTTSRV